MTANLKRYLSIAQRRLTQQCARRAYTLREILSGRTGIGQSRHIVESEILWLDLGDLGDLVTPKGAQEQWQDHGLGLLRTILHQEGIRTDILSTRSIMTWQGFARQIQGYRTLLMNVRSYTFPVAKRAAEIFKTVNPGGMVITGGMHASVSLDEMLAVEQFDRIHQGPGETIIVDLVKNPGNFDRVTTSAGASSMADWPPIDRTLWPKPDARLSQTFHWPLEPNSGWGMSGDVATILTSRVCPWKCAFCNENSFISNMKRRPVEAVIDELNSLYEEHPFGNVIIHDSMFFQNPQWLNKWLELYPKRATKLWPYWAAARTDTIRKWPDLFKDLIVNTNWAVVSLGLESGSDNMLRILNKECDEQDNYFAIDLINRLGDVLKQRPPTIFANIMLGIPGETPQDAFKTIAMLRSIKSVIPAISFFAPYPGSALGYQIIAEGKSLMSQDNYHRSPGDKKVVDVDYRFYKKLLRGGFDKDIAAMTINGISETYPVDNLEERLIKS